MIRPARSHGSRSCAAAGRPLHKENPAYIRRCRRGLFVLSPLARLLHLREKRRSTGFVPAVANFPGRIFLAEIFMAEFAYGSTRRIPLEITRRPRKASAGSASTPERGPAGSVHRVGQGRFTILFALAFELLLGFPEARDA